MSPASSQQMIPSDISGPTGASRQAVPSGPSGMCGQTGASGMAEMSRQTGAAMVLAAIESASRILITSHIRPDGDAVGSCGGLYHILKDAGKEVSIALADPVPPTFKYVFSNIEILQLDNPGDNWDLIIILDTGCQERTGATFDLKRLAPIAIIDHHITSQPEGLAVIEPDSSSTSELIFRLFGSCGWSVSREAAEALLLGLTTDTRTFQNRNVTAETHKTAAALMELGADRNSLLTRLENSKTMRDLRVLTDGLSMAEYNEDDGVAWVVYDQNYFAGNGFTPGQLWVCGIFNVLMMPREIDISITAIEIKPEITQVEFRSKNRDVSVLAKKLGGGGHILASGCCIEKSPGEAMKIILEQLTSSTADTAHHGAAAQ